MQILLPSSQRRSLIMVSLLVVFFASLLPAHMVFAQTPDNRFGMIYDCGVTSAPNLANMGATFWHNWCDDYPRSSTNYPVIRYRHITDYADNYSPKDFQPSISWSTIASHATDHPGQVWIIGNEPNLNLVADDGSEPGDHISPQRYAQFFKDAVDNILGNDPTARLVGPNVLNWSDDNTLFSPLTEKGQDYIDDFIYYYTCYYNGGCGNCCVPLYAIGIHFYDLAAHSPQLDTTSIASQAATADSSSVANHGLHIAVTEFGSTCTRTGCTGSPDFSAAATFVYNMVHAFVHDTGALFWMPHMYQNPDSNGLDFQSGGTLQATATAYYDWSTACSLNMWLVDYGVSGSTRTLYVSPRDAAYPYASTTVSNFNLLAYSTSSVSGVSSSPSGNGLYIYVSLLNNGPGEVKFTVDDRCQSGIYWDYTW